MRAGLTWLSATWRRADSRGDSAFGIPSGEAKRFGFMPSAVGKSMLRHTVTGRLSLRMVIVLRK